MAHIKDRARTCLDQLPTLYENEIILVSEAEYWTITQDKLY